LIKGFGIAIARGHERRFFYAASHLENYVLFWMIQKQQITIVLWLAIIYCEMLQAAIDGQLPSCQDTGTAIVMAKEKCIRELMPSGFKRYFLIHIKRKKPALFSNCS
jgi:hypothetical protein